MILRNLLFLFFLFRENFCDEFSDDISGSPTTGMGATIKIFRVSLCNENSAKSDFRNYSNHSIGKHTEILEVIFLRSLPKINIVSFYIYASSQQKLPYRTPPNLVSLNYTCFPLAWHN